MRHRGGGHKRRYREIDFKRDNYGVSGVVDSIEYDHFINTVGNYDYVFNLSALKHVRSERDPYTLMRMIKVNILNADKTIIQSTNSR